MNARTCLALVSLVLIQHESNRPSNSTPILSAFSGKKAPAIHFRAVLRSTLGRIFVVTFFALASWCAYGAPGEFDHAFGVDGKARFGVGFGNDNASALALQNDGKIIIAGESGFASEFAVVRLNPDGTLDSGFGSGGRVLVPIGISGAARAVALDANGRIVVAGSVPIPNTAGNSAFAAIRLNGDGTLDSSFGVGGKLMIPVKHSAAASAVAIDSSGNIILAGYATSHDIATYGTSFALVRLTPSGLLDTTFADGGIFTTSPRGEIRAITIDSLGRILATGSYWTDAGNQDYAVFRLLGNGTLDSAFGMRVFALSPHDDIPNSIALDASGRIVIAGSSLVPGGGYSTIGVFSAIRLNGDGSLDSTFGTDGAALVQLGLTTGATGGALAVDSTGKILIAGTYGSGLAVIRLNSTGTLDGAFGSGGVKMISESNGGFFAAALRLDAAERIVLTGSTGSAATSSEFAVTRLASSGALDGTFGTAGTVLIDIGHAPADVQAIARQPDGKLVVAGNCECGGTTEMVVARRNADGSPDLSFGSGGRLRISPGTGTSRAYGVAVDSSARLIIAGMSLSELGFSNFTVVRLNPSGSLDSSFGVGGKVSIPVGNNNNSGYALVLDSSGRILVAGSSLDINTAQVSFAVIRLNSNGSLDGTFGTGGKAVVPLPVGTFNSEANAIAVDAQGRIVLAGMGDGLRVARLLPNGSLDAAFGSGGSAVVPVSQTGLRSARDVALALAPGGKIVIAGYDNVPGTGPVFLVAKFNEDGTLDSSFGTAGVVRLSAGPGSWASFVHAVAVQPNGRIVIAGETWYMESFIVGGYTWNFTPKRIAVMRLNPDGALDGTFGAGGMLIVPVTPGDDVANALLLDTDGSILVAGDFSRAFGIVKLQGGDPPTVPDAVPNPFSFTDQTGLARGVMVDSAPIAVTGIAAPAQISIVGGSYSVNGAPYTALPGTVQIGDQVSVRLQTSYGFGTPASATVTIGGVSDTFIATTALRITLVSVVIVGPTSVNENETASYTAIATFSDGSTQTVTPVWTVLGAAASISASGLLTAYPVSSDTPISVFAEYGIGGMHISGISLFVMILNIPPVPDTQAPSVPTGLSATAVSGSQINLAWTASTDNVGVTAYQVYRAGVFRATVNSPTLNFSDTGLAASTLYSYTVAACDAAGNCSAQSSAASATTQPAGQTLTFSKTGNGTVTSAPAGINCGATCSFAFPNGQAVTLTASAAAGNRIGAWTGACAGIGTGTGTASGTCMLTMNAPLSAGVNFTFTGATLAMPLEQGFNLVGNSTTTALDVAATFGNVVDSMVAGVSDKVEAVWRWNATTRKWQFYTPQFSAAGSAAYATSHNFEVLTTIPAGEGYWISASPFTLNVPTGTGFNYGLISFGTRPQFWNLLSIGSTLTVQQFNCNVGAPPSPGVPCPANFESLWAWKAAAPQKWYFYSPQLPDVAPPTLTNCLYAANNGFLCFDTTGKTLGAGTGFWVHKP